MGENEMKPNSSSRNDATEKKMLRRREWKLEQERQRQHERLKQKKIYEYEMQRAREKGLLPPKPPNRSKSRSKSPRSRPRRPCTSSTTNTPILSERLESVDGTVPLFKGPEGTKISAAELRRIKVDIHRNIPGKSTDSDLQRDIINPEDVVVKRRAGEGSKPIFEREEIKGVVTKTEEVEERRTVVTVNNDTLDGKSKTFKKRSASLSPIRNRSHSPRRTLSRHSRERYRSRNGSREYSDRYGEKERRRTESHIAEEERNRRSRDHSRSRDREERKSDRYSHHRDERSYRYGHRRDRSGSREQRVPPPHYFGQIPVPIYYSHFPPRPIMMANPMQIRGQAPMMLRPFPPPRFILPDRLRTPSNPRFGPMY
ncbi:feminizer isoform X3 [Halictus rubicundus]|uniref:feminizer isoform X3 n=1 Tax=Halictus rubicundus TaxID=77578 RepID=UPI004035D856